MEEGKMNGNREGKKEGDSEKKLGGIQMQDKET